MAFNLNLLAHSLSFSPFRFFFLSLSLPLYHDVLCLNGWCRLVADNNYGHWSSKTWTHTFSISLSLSYTKTFTHSFLQYSCDRDSSSKLASSMALFFLSLFSPCPAYSLYFLYPFFFSLSLLFAVHNGYTQVCLNKVEKRYGRETERDGESCGNGWTGERSRIAHTKHPTWQSKTKPTLHMAKRATISEKEDRAKIHTQNSRN